MQHQKNGGSLKSTFFCSIGVKSKSKEPETNSKERKAMDKDKINLLIVDDEEQFLSSISRSLALRDFNVIAVNRGDLALESARKNPIDIALVDLKMPGMDGRATLEALKKEHPWMEIVILTGHGTIESAAACTRSGAYSYLQKPCEFDRLIEALIQAYKQRVMNKQKIEEEKMNKLLKIAMGSGPKEILRRLREIDSRGA
jgi:DNA-binding NtrC family response regulator